MLVVNCDALPRQINYLTDEADYCGNAVVSRLDFFHNHALERRKSFSTLIITLDGIKTAWLNNIWWWWINTSTSCFLSSLLALRSFFQTGALVCLSASTVERKWVAPKTSLKWSTPQLSVIEYNVAQLVSRKDGMIIVTGLDQLFCHSIPGSRSYITSTSHHLLLGMSSSGRGVIQLNRTLTCSLDTRGNLPGA